MTDKGRMFPLTPASGGIFNLVLSPEGRGDRKKKEEVPSPQGREG
jgi:hypothetical protein